MGTLRARLSEAGLKRKFLNEAVLPSWWEESMAMEPGGFREAAAYIAAHLGYSLKSLLDPSEPLAFSQAGRVKFKKAKDKTEEDVCLATQLALGLARSVAKACSGKPAFTKIPPPQEWRDKLLEKADKPGCACVISCNSLGRPGYRWCASPICPRGRKSLMP